MKSFSIHELNKKLKVKKEFCLDDGFKYRVKSSSLGVKEIIILNPYIVDNLILNNFDRRYKKILEYYLSILQSDDGNESGNFMIALDEIARLRSILIRKYNLVVSKKIEEKMLKKLKILENEIRIKVVEFKLIKEQEHVNTMNEQVCGKSR